jgi:flagellar basal body rod protein FlgG
MDPAYYVAAGSLKMRGFQMEVLSNNLANVATTGYKGDRTFFSIFNKAKSEGVSKLVNDGVAMGQRGVVLDQGTLQATGKSLDLALEGEGFFVVQTPQGQRLTRDGRMKLGSGGQLQALDGAPLLGKSGQPLTVNPAGAKVAISPDGTVQQGAEVIGQLELRDVSNPLALQKVGNTRFDVQGIQFKPAKATVAQGYTEASGVDTASAMVEMIRINRLFDMSMRVASTLSNDLDARSIADVGGLR